MPMGVPKMWEEGRLKVEPARENTCREGQTNLEPAPAQPKQLHCVAGNKAQPEGTERGPQRALSASPAGSHLSGGDGSRG